ncbi:MAG: hypothetical protein QNL14_06190, partial [Deltaproteobacteria bacterium]|nr:hypothetical protein [Deltaproteobacteria bacterium]
MDFSYIFVCFAQEIKFGTATECNHSIEEASGSVLRNDTGEKKGRRPNGCLPQFWEHGDGYEKMNLSY